MALIKTERLECDVCKGNVKMDTSPKQNTTAKLHQVIFTTEQTEGRCVKPYLSQQTLDLCEKCNETLISGQMIFASGAMGYNRYYFKEQNPLTEE